MVRRDEKKGTRKEDPEYVPDDEKNPYVWFEIGIFTFWDEEGMCKVLCVDAPSDMPTRLKTALQQRRSPLDFRDPFSMHTDLLDLIIVYYDISIWRIRDPIRNLEKVCAQEILRRARFVEKRTNGAELLSRPDVASGRIYSSRCTTIRGMLSTSPRF